MDWITTPWGASAVAMACATLLVLARMGYRLRASRDGIEATRQSQTRTVEPIMPDRYVKPAFELVERAITHNNTMRDIWPECLEKQMLIYEEHEVTVISMLVEDFSRLIDGFKFPEETIEDEISRFRSHICNAFVVVKDHVRRSFRNNHYWEMTADEWDHYMTTKQATIVRLVSGELDKFWRSPVIPRASLKTIGKSGASVYGGVIAEVFKRARLISIKAHEREVETQATYSSWVMMMTGRPYPGEGECA